MTEEQARARVQAFIADFHAAWARSGSVPMPTFNPFVDPEVDFDPLAWAQSQAPPDFDAWTRELATIAEKHFTAGSMTGAEGALTGKPDHDPTAERIVSVQVKRATAEVRTVFPDVTSENHFTYRLAASDDGWLISKIVRSDVPPEVPLMAADTVERQLAALDPDLSAQPAPRDLTDGMNALFSGRFEVVQLGDITTTGVLTAHDFGWVRFDTAPFHRRVPAGSYPVELVHDGEGTNVALRVRFGDEEAIERVPAMRVGVDHVVMVDAGNVAILDFAALASCGQAQVEEVFQDQIQGLGTDGVVFSLTEAAPDAVMVRSGYGDGAYPMFWGVAADGSTTDLLVDFLVAVEDITTTVTAPWRVGVFDDPELAAHGFEVRVDADGVVFRYRQEAEGSSLADIRVVDAEGDAVPGGGGGVFVQGDVSERRWLPDGPVPPGASVEVSLTHGYRHV